MLDEGDVRLLYFFRAGFIFLVASTEIYWLRNTWIIRQKQIHNAIEESFRRQRQLIYENQAFTTCIRPIFSFSILNNDHYAMRVYLDFYTHSHTGVEWVCCEERNYDGKCLLLRLQRDFMVSLFSFFFFHCFGLEKLNWHVISFQYCITQVNNNANSYE